MHTCMRGCPEIMMYRILIYINIYIYIFIYIKVRDEVFWWSVRAYKILDTEITEILMHA